MVASAFAGPPSETFLPNTTKGYVTVANPKSFNEQWDKTQLGQLLDDEMMQPFVEDFKKQLREEVGSIQESSASRPTTSKASPSARRAYRSSSAKKPKRRWRSRWT